jgi:hypothetical protein
MKMLQDCSTARPVIIAGGTKQTGHAQEIILRFLKRQPFKSNLRNFGKLQQYGNYGY